MIYGAYWAHDLPLLLGIRASVWALVIEASLQDVCMAASWSSLHTFVRFYSLNEGLALAAQDLSIFAQI